MGMGVTFILMMMFKVSVPGMCSVRSYLRTLFMWIHSMLLVVWDEFVNNVQWTETNSYQNRMCTRNMNMMHPFGIYLSRICHWRRVNAIANGTFTATYKVHITNSDLWRLSFNKEVNDKWSTGISLFQSRPGTFDIRELVAYMDASFLSPNDAMVRSYTITSRNEQNEEGTSSHNFKIRMA